MPKKRLPLLLKISIFLSRIRKPIIPRFILKKTRKSSNHYNSYRYIKEYEFSPSNTPLVQLEFHRKSKILKNISSIIFVSKCLKMVKDKGEEERYPLGIEIEPLSRDRDSVGRELCLMADLCSDDDAIDERAEEFIRNFYEEMRRQKQ